MMWTHGKYWATYWIALSGLVLTSIHGVAATAADSQPVAQTAALLNTVSSASEESYKRMRIESFDPELFRLIAPDAMIETLVSGGDLGVAPAGQFDYGASLESPLWWEEGGFLLFSDIPQDRIMKWEPGKGLSVFRQPSGHANGLWRDPQGRLLMCEHSGRQVTRREVDGSITVVMRSYRGQRLNRPNTVIVRSDGGVYFTDLKFRTGPTEDWDVDFEGIYYVSPDLGTRTLLLRDLQFPHKLLFSPDEKTLYVGQRQGILAYDIIPPSTHDLTGVTGGRLNPESKRWFWKAGAQGPQEPAVLKRIVAGNLPLVDGMKMDVEGNFYIGGGQGIWIISARGKLLGHLDAGGLATPNLAFGGADGKTLFFVTNHALHSVKVKIPGMPIPAKSTNRH